MPYINKNVATIATYLLANASEQKGVSVVALANEFPAIGRSTIYRIVRNNPAFREALYPFHPRGYWYDPSKVEKLNGQQNKGSRPEIEPKPIREWLRPLQMNLRANTEFDNQSPVYKKLADILAANNHSVAFQKNEEELDPVVWKEAQAAVETLLNFAYTLQVRLESLINDSRYDSPEWWALFPKED